MNRREFFKSLFSIRPKEWERPPGAVAEGQFEQLCTGCDACMIACPVDVIMIDDLEKRLPLIYPKEAPCIHCANYPCIQACSTGALRVIM